MKVDFKQMVNSKRRIIVQSSQQLLGKVVWREGWKVKIAVGAEPKPDATIYLDANPCQFEVGQMVDIELRLKKELKP